MQSTSTLNEKTDHIVIVCTYVQSHDRECTYMHFNIYKETVVKLDKAHWCEHVPKLVKTVLLSTTKKMQRYTIFFIIVSALHVSCGFSACCYR
jgi:hypothetical protein